MNEFIERYKTLSNSDLLRVIENQSDYQTKAVEAAKIEIQQRNLSDQEVDEAKSTLETDRQERKKQKEKRAVIEQKVINLGTSLFDIFNPIQKSTPTAEKLIRLITIVFGLIAVIKWYDVFGLIKIMLTDNSAGWDLSILVYLFPVIFLSIATILFGSRKKMGWVLMAIYLTYSAINTFGIIIRTWNMEPTEILGISNTFPQTSTNTQILITLFFGGILWVLSKKEIKEHYRINRRAAITTLGITAALTIIFIAPSLLL